MKLIFADKYCDRADNILLTVNRTEFRLVHNQTENCQHDHVLLSI